MSEYINVAPIEAEILDEIVVRNRTDINRISEARILSMTQDARSLITLGESRVALGLVESSQRGKDFNETHLSLLLAPYGNGLSPAMMLRGMMLQRSLGDGTSPLLILPNNTVSERAYTFASEDDDFSPLSFLGEQQARAVQQFVKSKTKKDVTYDLIGYSQGAAVMPHVAQYLGGVRSMVSGDAPNTQADRTPKQLKKDFMKTSLGDLNGAILDSRILALNHFQGVRENGRTTSRQLLSLLNALRSSRLLENRLLHTAMAGDTHAADIAKALQVQSGIATVAIARAEESAIFTATDFARYQDDLGGSNGVLPHGTMRWYELAGYGHEAADNITLFAQFGRTALAPSAEVQ